jgi:hypothetical protein
VALVNYVDSITIHSNKGDKAILISDVDNIELVDILDRKMFTERQSGRLSFIELVTVSIPQQYDLSFIFLATLVTLLNTGCVFAVNTLYLQIIKSDNISQNNKIVVQFAVSIFMCFWNSMAIGYMISRLGPNVSQEINLQTLYRVINNILMSEVVVAFSSSKCFSAFFFGLGEITNTVEYTKCSVQSYSNGVIKCTEYTTAYITDTIERPFVYNGGCTDEIMIDYIPVHIYAYAFDIVTQLTNIIGTKCLYKSQSIIHLPKVAQIDLNVKRRRIICSGKLFTFVFGHFALLLTFGLSSPFLSAIILIACMQDVYMYIYYMRKYLEASDRVKYPWRKGDTTGGLEDACVGIPKSFRFSIILIMFSSALFNACVIVDKSFSETHKEHETTSHLVDLIFVFISPFILVFIITFVQVRYLDFQKKYAGVNASPSLL